MITDMQKSQTYTHPLEDGPTPLYAQIKHRLHIEITQGLYKPGDRLPSEAELMQIYGVSRITVRQALAALEVDGLVIRQHGKGSFVTEPKIPHALERLSDFIEDMERAGQVPSSKVIDLRHNLLDSAIAHTLGLRADEPLTQIEQLRMANGKQVAIDKSWIPSHYGITISDLDLEHETIFRLLSTRYQLHAESGRYTLTAANATNDQAQWLDVAPGSALLRVERLLFVEGDQPFYLQHRFYRPDRIQYQIVLQRSPRNALSTTILREMHPVVPESGLLVAPSVVKPAGE